MNLIFPYCILETVLGLYGGSVIVLANKLYGIG